MKDDADEDHFAPTSDHVLVELLCDCGWYMLVPPGTEGIDCGGPECREGGLRDFGVPCPLGRKVGISTHMTGVTKLRAFKARVAALLPMLDVPVDVGHERGKALEAERLALLREAEAPRRSSEPSRGSRRLR